MESLRHPGDVLRFGPFELDLQQGEVRKHGVRIKLQSQPFQVLAALLENPGTLVTRDELRRRLWPEDTFVDFEHSLNGAVARLRQALNDSAEKPRYIETLAKRGYRFISELDEIKEAVPPNQVAVPKHEVRPWFAAAVLLGAIAVVAFLLRSNRTAPAAIRPVPLTTFRGIEAKPSLSPDGRYVAFTRNGEKQDNFDIYVMPISSDARLRLTSTPAEDVSPAWSPDGRTTAFLRRLGGEWADLFVIPATGGPEHKIGEVRDDELIYPSPRLVSLAWSPDGRWIAASHRGPEDTTERIYVFSRTGEKRALTLAPPGLIGDHTPAFSADGRALAFSRLMGYSASEIYIVPLDLNSKPTGEARPLTAAKRWSVNPVWTGGGPGILYLRSEEPPAPHQLRFIASTDGRASDQTIALNDDPFEIALGGRHLVYSRKTEDTNIWRARIPAPGEPPSMPELFISSTRRDDRARYSPDGSKIAFNSSRSGSSEIWVSKADGSTPVRLTNFGGPVVGYPNWSSDGHWLIFHARPEGQADVFVMPAAGGSVKRLTTHSADDTQPSYSHDGKWIYFSSERSGQVQIWKMPATGVGEAVQLTRLRGYMPVESRDGRAVFYYARDNSALWSVPIHGGPSTKAVGPTNPDGSGFAVTAEGMYYAAPLHAGEQSFIQFFSFSTRQSRPVAVANHQFDLGMSVSPDSKYILFDQYDSSGSDLMLVENFRP